MSSRHPLNCNYLDTAEKQVVFEKYSAVKSEKKYAECLQLFIADMYRKQVSCDYIHKFISRKRSRRVNIKEYLIDATQAPGFDWKDTFLNQYKYCIASSSQIAEAVNGGKVTQGAIIHHLRNLSKAHGCLPRYKRSNVESVAEQSGAPTNTSSTAANMTTIEKFSTLTTDDDAADHDEFIVVLRYESLVAISTAVDDVLVEAPVGSAVGANLGSVNSSLDRAENQESPTAELTGAQASLLFNVAMISEDPSHNSAFYSPQDHESGSHHVGVDIAAAAAVAAAAEVGQMDNSGASTGRQLIGEFSIASITTEQMKVDGCNIVGLAGKDARDHYAKRLKAILPVNHRVSLDDDDSGDLYMFMYYDSKKPSNRLPVGCVFFKCWGRLRSNHSVLAVHALYPSAWSLPTGAFYHWETVCGLP